MAGDWIKMRSELPTHPKVVRILSAMRPQDVRTVTDKFRVIGGLHAVWSVFDTHSSDGVLMGYTPDLLDHVIGWEGFSGAMIAVGWLEFDGAQTLVLPEFDEHNSASAKRRAEDQKRKRNGRKSESRPPPSGQIADKTRTESGPERDREKSKPISTTDVVEKRGSPLPDDWLPDVEGVRFCETERPDLRVAQVVARFRDYWTAQPGQRGRKKDWAATWRNWVRNERAAGAQSRGFLDAQAETFAAFSGRSEEDVDRDNSRTIDV